MAFGEQNGFGAPADESTPWPPDADAPAPDEEKRPIPREVLLLGGLLGIAILAIVISAGWGLVREKALVPSVAGLPPAVAAAAIEKASLTPGIAGRTATDQFPDGLIISQTPTAQVAVAPGSAVDVVVAVAPKPAIVPDVVLIPQQAAETALTYALFEPAIYWQVSSSVVYGNVVSQWPAPGETAETGSRVAVFLSLGPATSGAVVPDVVGSTLASATAEIHGARLIPQLFERPANPSSKSTVVQQLPAPGTRVPVGTAVPIFVASPVH